MLLKTEIDIEAETSTEMETSIERSAERRRRRRGRRGERRRRRQPLQTLLSSPLTLTNCLPSMSRIILPLATACLCQIASC
jgi:hypothetical protein